MTFKSDDRIYETSVTTGTGTYTLDGAVTGFQAFSTLGANDCPYFATDDTNWEVGIGSILTGPSRIARTTIISSSNADAAVNWGVGTRKIRCGLPAAMAFFRSLSKSVAGAANVTLTQDEQSRDVITLTGALTGSINIVADNTEREWTVYNNTTGAFTLTYKNAGTGIAVTQGKSRRLRSDGTNVVDAISETGPLNIAGALTVTGNATLGTGAASTSPAMVLNGGATNAFGPFIQFQRNSVTKGYFGSSSGILGDSTDDLVVVNAGVTSLRYTGLQVTLTTGGNLNLATSPGGIRSVTDVTNGINILNGTAPVGLATNAVTFYATSGEARVMDAAGNATLLSPHDGDRNWIHHCVKGNGEEVLYRVEEFFDFLNTKYGEEFKKATGKDFVETYQRQLADVEVEVLVLSADSTPEEPIYEPETKVVPQWVRP